MYSGVRRNRFIIMPTLSDGITERVTAVVV